MGCGSRRVVGSVMQFVRPLPEVKSNDLGMVVVEERGRGKNKSLVSS